MSAIWRATAPLVLASKSAIRARMLRDAGVPVEAAPSSVDERGVEAAMTAGSAPAAVALALARAKALDVARGAPGRLVAGADQTLDRDGERFTKPTDRDGARRQLERLSGRAHALASGAALARDGAIVWEGVATARLTMRTLSAAFIESYLDEAGGAVLTSVGAYQIEGLGAQLFERIEGDVFTIMGLPLLPLLGALRESGALDG